MLSIEQNPFPDLRKNKTEKGNFLKCFTKAYQIQYTNFAIRQKVINVECRICVLFILLFVFRFWSLLAMKLRKYGNLK